MLFIMQLKWGDINAVNLLLANRADVNSINILLTDDGEVALTSLYAAIRFNNLEITQLLLSHGANPNFDCSRHILFYSTYHAAKFGNGELMELLINHGARIDKISNERRGTPLHTACMHGNYEAVVALINNGANVNASSTLPNRGCDHWTNGTPLDWAAFNLKYSENPKNLDLVKYLVVNGGVREYYPSYEGSLCPVINGYLKSVHK